MFLLKLLPTHFRVHCQILLVSVTTVVFEWWFSVSLISFTCTNWNSSVRKGYHIWIYIFNKIFRISTNLELKDVNHVKMIPHTNIKERKVLVTCFRKYNELKKENSIYCLWVWFSIWPSIDFRLNSEFSWSFTSGLSKSL